MTRSIFSTGLRRSIGAGLAVAVLAACDDTPTIPDPMPMLVVEASAMAFANTDPQVGSDEMIAIEARNDGDSDVSIFSVMLEGSDAADFSLDNMAAVTLGAGESMTFNVGFMPAANGSKSVNVVFLSNDPNAERTEVALSGMAETFQYTQVDRKGIPALNTVFNHPSGTAGFDKTLYNVSSPAGDVATYTSQFETVLGAVGNADPAATAALLLPDELPVSLGASPTAFASLTGRTLSDDATDVALFVTVGAPELQSDNVDANDLPFLTTFPYVAPPHN